MEGGSPGLGTPCHHRDDMGWGPLTSGDVMGWGLVSELTSQVNECLNLGFGARYGPTTTVIIIKTNSS